MAISRRKFIGRTAATVAAAYLPWKYGAGAAYPFSQSPATIPLFGTTLRGVGPGGIPVAAPDQVVDPLTGLLVNAPAPITGVTHYTMDINRFEDSIAPTLGPTVLFGYNPVNPLGGGVQRDGRGQTSPPRQALADVARGRALHRTIARRYEARANEPSQHRERRDAAPELESPTP